MFSGFFNKIVIDFKKSFGDNFIQGCVKSVDTTTKKVTLESGQVIDYTDLVFAVGSVGPFPGSTDISNAEDLNIACKKLRVEVVYSTVKHLSFD